jgi:uncharacterized protein
MQEQLIFFPEKLPPDFVFKFPGKYQELNFQTEPEVRINGLLFKGEPSRGIVLYFHGNAGSLRIWGHIAKDFTQH